MTHRARLLPGPVERYDRLENAFDAAYPPGDSERRVLVTVAAADAASLPNDIPRTQYGATGREWTPYFEESKRPLAQQAADIATTLGYLPEVGELAEYADELVSDAPPTRATVLLVDPRAVTVAESRKTLQRIDGASKPISVVVIWNPKAFTAGEEADLRDALAAALPHKLVEGRATSVLAIKGVPTLADFGSVVPVVLRAAERSFLRFAPPSGAHDAPGK
jgi:FxsC-like protein